MSWFLVFIFLGWFVLGMKNRSDRNGRNVIVIIVNVIRQSFICFLNRLGCY